MITVNKIRDFVAAEAAQGNDRCSVRLSKVLTDVVYLHVDDTSLSFSFLSRLASAVSSDFEICSCLTSNSISFDIQFIID